MIDIDKLIKEGDIEGLGKFAKQSRDAMLEFVQRVDEGSIRSKRTYSKFKKILLKMGI